MIIEISMIAKEKRKKNQLIDIVMKRINNFRFLLLLRRIEEKVLKKKSHQLKEKTHPIAIYIFFIVYNLLIKKKLLYISIASS